MGNCGTHCLNEKFWLEDPRNLLCSDSLLPMDSATLEEQLNSISRLVLLLFVILAAVRFDHSLWFLLLALIAVILIYYIEKRTRTTTVDSESTQNFTNNFSGKYNSNSLNSQKSRSYSQMTSDEDCPEGTTTVFRTVSSNPSSYSEKARLLNIVNQPYVQIPRRNTSTLAGTVKSTGETVDVDICSGSWPDHMVPAECVDPTSEARRFTGGFQVDGPGSSFGPNTPTPNAGLQGGPNPKTRIPPVMVPRFPEWEYWKPTNYNYPTLINSESNVDLWRSGFAVSTDCPPSYIADKIGRANSCSSPPQETMIDVSILDPVQIQNLQPGVFTSTNINEPINSNLGISYPEQLPPKTCTRTPGGDLMFLRGYQQGSSLETPACGSREAHMVDRIDCSIHPTGDSNGCSAVKENFTFQNQIQTVDVSLDPPASQGNVYDPRFTGHGSDNRYYLENTVKQPRYFYDDINSAKMPNYLSRNNIDIFPFADQYQSQTAQGNLDTANIRALAGDAFMESTLQHRTELMESRMRKRNAQMHQLRSAPISRNGQRMMGSVGSGNK